MKKIVLIGFLAISLAGCGKKEDAAQKPLGQNPVDAPADYLSVMAKAQKSAIKTVDTASLKRAIEMFQVSEGRNPKTLDELVPDYIPQLPPAPAGMKFEYDAQAGSIKVVAK